MNNLSEKNSINSSSYYTRDDVSLGRVNTLSLPFDAVLFRRLNNIILVSIQYVGIVSNLLMLVVFYQGNLRKLSFSTFIRCLAFFCACHNSYYLFDYYNLVTFYADQYEIMCRLKVFFHLFTQPVCAWFEVLASLDRFLTIVFPLKFRLASKPFRRLCLAAFVILFNTACYSNYLLQNQIKFDNQATKCPIVNRYKLVMIDFVNGAAVPFTLMIVLSVATFVGVRKAHQRVRSSSKEDRARRTRIRDNRFGATMIVLNIVFVLFNLPHRFFNVLMWHSIPLFDNPFVRNLIRDVFAEFYEAYYAIIFLIQLAVNNQVRREFLLLLARVCRFFKSLF